MEAWVPAPRTAAPDWLPQPRGSRDRVKKSIIWHLKQAPNCALEAVKAQILQLDSLRGQDLAVQNPELYAALFD